MRRRRSSWRRARASCSYSDGLVEAHDPKCEMFGFQRLRRMVAEHAEVGSLVDFLMDDFAPLLGMGGSKRTTSL
jgi:hypothetical protein